MRASAPQPSHFTWHQETSDERRAYLRTRLGFNVRMLLRYLEKFDGNLSARNTLGFLYYQQEKIEQALDCFRVVLKHEPNNPVALRLMAHHYRQTNRPSDAEAELRKISDDGTLSLHQQWTVLLNKGMYYRCTFEYRKCMAVYQQAIELRPDNYRSYLFKAITQRRFSDQQRNDKQVQSYEAVIALLEKSQALYQQDNHKVASHKHLFDLHTARALHGLITIEFRQQKPRMGKIVRWRTLAVAAFKRALAIAPHDENTFTFLSKFMRSAKKPRLAIDLLTPVIAEHPSTAAYHSRAMAYVFQRNYRQAEQDLREALRLEPKNDAARLDLVHCCFSLKQFDEALDHYGLLHDPSIISCGRARRLYADIRLQRSGELAQSEDTEGAARERGVAIQSLWLGVRTLEADEDHWYSRVSEKLMQLLNEDYRANPTAHTFLELVELHGGSESEPGFAFLEAGVDAHQRDASAMNLFARALVLKGQFERALVYFRHAFTAAEAVGDRRMMQQVARNCRNLALMPEITIFEPHRAMYFADAERWEAQLHADDALRVLWRRQLRVMYPGKTAQKQVVLSAENHISLRHQVNRRKAEWVAKTKQNVPNYLSVSLTFIVSDRPHQPGGAHRRVALPIDVDIPLLATDDDAALADDPTQQRRFHVSDYDDYRRGGKGRWPRSASLLAEVLESKPLSRHPEIQAWYDDDTDVSFQRNFHCSERSLYGYLNRPEVFRRIIERLEVRMRAQTGDDEATGFKVYALVVDGHSIRYLCDDCEQSAFFWYHPRGAFMQKLRTAILDRGHKVLTKSDNLATVLRYSTNPPERKNKSGEVILDPTRKTLADHTNDVVNIRAHQAEARVVVLQRDDAVLEGVVEPVPHSAVFTSSGRG